MDYFERDLKNKRYNNIYNYIFVPRTNVRFELLSNELRPEKSLTYSVHIQLLLHWVSWCTRRCHNNHERILCAGSENELPPEGGAPPPPELPLAQRRMDGRPREASHGTRGPLRHAAQRYSGKIHGHRKPPCFIRRFVFGLNYKMKMIPHNSYKKRQAINNKLETKD